jgi:AcrR family transcriptional regulator
MGRRATVSESELMARLGRVFRDVGYEGATLSVLSDATGLKKASLYHRFPGGKEQMAREVLADAEAWLDENILTPLRGNGPPKARIGAMARKLDDFYSGGKQACLLNMLSSARVQEGPFVEPIKRLFETMIGALARVLRDAGQGEAESRHRAQRAIMLLHGSLVLSRGMGSTQPFRRFLKTLPAELLNASVPSGGVSQPPRATVK